MANCCGTNEPMQVLGSRDELGFISRGWIGNISPLCNGENTQKREKKSLTQFVGQYWSHKNMVPSSNPNWGQTKRQGCRYKWHHIRLWGHNYYRTSLRKEWILGQSWSHLYEDPLSIKATALLLGAPTTLVLGTTMLLFTITASIKTFHR